MNRLSRFQSVQCEGPREWLRVSCEPVGVRRLRWERFCSSIPCGSLGLWYPSAGMDLKPLVACSGWRLPVGLFVYNSLEAWPFLQWCREYEAGRPFQPLRTPEGVLEVSEFIPVRSKAPLSRIPHDGTFDLSFADGYEQNRGTSIDAAAMRVRLAPGEGQPPIEARLLFIDCENTAFARAMIFNGTFRPDIFCTIRDGCMYGHNLSCVQELDRLFCCPDATAVVNRFSPAFWISDGHASSCWAEDIKPEGIATRRKLAEWQTEHACGGHLRLSSLNWASPSPVGSGVTPHSIWRR